MAPPPLRPGSPEPSGQDERAPDAVPADFLRQVREALAHLYDLAYLQSHPLARLLQPRPRSADAARALQRSLLDAVELLRPVADSPDPHAWRGYRILRLRYVEALPVAEVAEKLAIGHAELFRDQRTALQAVASFLQTKWGLADRGVEPIVLRVAKVGPGEPATREGPPRHNLRLALTGFVGRGREKAEVTALLQSSRLLTLTGTGGCGKTRLALEIIRELAGSYADGVWLVSLAAVTDPELVCQAVATALGLPEEPGVPLEETLLRRLEHREMLLLLDNCEHLAGGCARLVNDLLGNCPNLTVLATSRQSLEVPGEAIWRVPSLSVPPPGDSGTAESLAQYEAVQLFVERARLVKPSFALAEGNAATVALICRRLDGIPLAVELAAARTGGLDLEEIATRMDDRFRFLTGGSRMTLPRQQTLRATLDWSHDLLTKQERVLLRRLAVFVGGWTLEAAEAACAGETTGDGIAREEILDLVLHLVDRSLVVVEESTGKARYRLLETIREYALDRLAEAEETELLRDRHWDWFLKLAEQAEPELHRALQRAWLDRLEVEHANFRAALEWCLERDADAGLGLAVALSRFWEVRGGRTEGLHWLRSLLARATEPTSRRAWALCHAGRMASLQEDEAAASAPLEESLALFRKIEDRRGVGWALLNLSFVARYDRERSLPLLEEALATFREIGDVRGTASALRELGIGVGHGGDHTRAVMLLRESLSLQRSTGDLPHLLGLNRLGVMAQFAGEYDQARALLEEGLSISRQIGDQEGIAWGLGDLGNLALCLGDYRQAQALIQESLSIERSTGSKLGIMWRLFELGKLASIEGDLDEARRLLDESLVLSRELGAPQVRGLILAGLGNVARLAGRLDDASQLVKDGLTVGSIPDSEPTVSQYLWLSGAIASQLGAQARATRLIAATFAHGPDQTLFTPADQSDCDLVLTAARIALGDEAFFRAWAEGQAMSLEQAVEYALAGSEG